MTPHGLPFAEAERLEREAARVERVARAMWCAPRNPAARLNTWETARFADQEAYREAARAAIAAYSEPETTG